MTMEHERPLSESELAAIEARAKAASAAPWMVNGAAAGGWRIDDADPSRLGISFLLSPTALVRDKADADFIADARQDIPTLCAEVRRLQQRLARVI